MISLQHNNPNRCPLSCKCWSYLMQGVEIIPGKDETFPLHNGDWPIWLYPPGYNVLLTRLHRRDGAINRRAKQLYLTCKERSIVLGYSI